MTFNGKLTLTTALIPETTVIHGLQQAAGDQDHTQVLKVNSGTRALHLPPRCPDIVSPSTPDRPRGSPDNHQHRPGHGRQHRARSTSVQHTACGQRYVIRVTVVNDKKASSVTAVSFGMIDPGAQDPKDDDDDNIIGGISDFAKQYAWLIVAAAGVVGLVAYALGFRHPVVLIVGIGLLVVAALLKYGVL